MSGKLTKGCLKELERAARHHLGVVDTVDTVAGWVGLQRAAWHARMSRYVADGWFKPYVHGGYEITEAGRKALEAGHGG